MIAIFFGSTIASDLSTETLIDECASVQPLSESIELMVKDLERGIVLLENIRLAKIHLNNVSDIITPEIVKLLALVKAGKIEGHNLVLVNKLVATFRIYSEQLAKDQNITKR
jgi:hypothetical protein